VVEDFWSLLTDPRKESMVKESMVAEKAKAVLKSIAPYIPLEATTIESGTNWIKSVRSWHVVALVFAIFSSWMLAQPLWRWNVALMMWMPICNGWVPFLSVDRVEPIWSSYVDWELDHNPAMFVPSKPVVELEAKDYSWAEFMRLTNNGREPIVFRGLFNNTRPLETFHTDEWLDKYGDFKVQEIKKSNDGFKYAYTIADSDETFKDYVKDIKMGNHRYSYGLDELYTQHPELVAHLEYERLGRHDGVDYTFCRSVAVFVGAGGEGLHWHNADHANLGIMVRGQKTFHLIDPKFSPLLGPDGNANPFDTGYAARSRRDQFAKVPELAVTFGPGDMLYTPPWWWHRIDSHGDAEDNLVIFSVCRFGAIWASLWNQPVLEMYGHMHSRAINWIHPSIPHVFRWVPWFRVLQDGIREYFGWMPRWDSDDCFSSKKTACGQLPKE